ncbi:MAG: lamin tail domain-containing protein, partial [Bacteroides sp.]|nr:lamin tail domain-containing protein [Bacteroides sp.]
DDLMPTVIIISNGDNGLYKHPRQSTLNTYSSMNPAPTVFQANKYTKGGVGGNVPDAFIADLESVDADGTIIISADDTAGTFSVSYREISHTFQIKNREQHVTGQVVIESLLPDPLGSDRLHEAVTLRNDSSATVPLEGWTLEDLSGRIWSFAGVDSLDPGESATILRNGMPMSLNNGGDTVHLYDGSHRLVDRYEYTVAQRGVTISTSH